MHELSIAREIVETVKQHLPAGTIREVKSVRLRLGEQAALAPEPLRFCFELASAGTALSGARLEIEAGSGDGLEVVEIELAE